MNALASVVAGGMAVAFAWAAFGSMAFDPSAIDWVMISDRGQAFLGWHLYRNAPWSFPLGSIPGFVAPLGASLANTDAIPLFGVALGLFSPILPPTFQPIGLWYGLCYFALGFTAFRLLDALIDDWVVSLTATALVIVNPVLLFRRIHPSLCAQWLVLAAFLAYVHSSGRRPRRRFLLSWGSLLFVAAGIHPYLAAMVLAIGVAALARRLGEGVALSATCADGLALGGTTLASLYLFGYLALAPGAPGFGGYSANLATLADPNGWSWLLPDVPEAAGQYEGFAFLGLGWLVTLLGAIALRVVRRGPDRARQEPLPPLTPLLILVVASGLFSLSSQVRLGDRLLVDLGPLYAWLEPLPSTFRASGRFIWPLFYLLLIGALVAAARLIGRRWMTTAALLLAVVAQLADGRAAYSTQKVALMALTNPWPRLRSACWRDLGASYDELVLFPPSIVDAPCEGDARPRFLYMPFAYLAGLEDMALNSGHLSRPPRDAAAHLCDALEREVSTGAVRPRAVYVVSDEALERFTPYWSGRARCGRIDGFWVCAGGEATAHLQSCLHDRPGAPIR